MSARANETLRRAPHTRKLRGLINHPAIEVAPVGQLRPYSRNARRHSKRQIAQIANSIEKFGFNNPVLIDEADQIMAGHGRVRPPSSWASLKCQCCASRTCPSLRSGPREPILL